MTDLNALATFVTVGRSGSFAEAARRLQLSPAMVGRRVRMLEESYGVRLVERTTRSLRLTDAGQEFLTRAAAILEAVDDLAEVLNSGEGPLVGRVRVSGPITLGARRLASIVAAQVVRFRGLSIELSLSDRKVDLVAEGFDLAIRIGEMQPSGLIARKIGNYRLVCCASPAILDQHGTPASPGDLSGVPCVINLNVTPRDRWAFVDPSGRTLSVPVNGPLEMGNDEAQRLVALGGAGFIYVPRHLVADDLREGRLVEVLSAWPKPEMPIYAVHPSRRLVPRRVTALIEAIAVGIRDD